MSRPIHLISYAVGIAGADPASAEGPLLMQRSPFLTSLSNLHWDLTLHPETESPKKAIVLKACEALAQKTCSLTKSNDFFIVLGGDHSCAIGTWSGVAKAKAPNHIGLIWIDAHMDSHTPNTSVTGNIHGMPLAALLGYGDESFTHLLSAGPKLLPENICLIGVRSYERGEAELLKSLNVRIFYMDEIEQRGFTAVFQEAVAIVSRNTTGFGISFDLDSIDPSQAPGTGVAEPNGLAAESVCVAFGKITSHSNLLGVEIVEFDPKRDKNQLTEKLIAKLISALSTGK